MVDPEALTTLRRILEQTRQYLDYANMQLKQGEEPRYLRWRYRRCEFIKEFTRPMPSEAAASPGRDPAGGKSGFQPDSASGLPACWGLGSRQAGCPSAESG